jgi:hypothetical protein
MDSYDEVHYVKDGREITSPDLEVSDSIRFVNEIEDENILERDEEKKKSDFGEVRKMKMKIFF